MEAKTLDLSCRGCGAALAIDDKICKYCGGPVSISTFTSVNSMPLPMINKYANSYRADLQQNPNNTCANKAAAYCYLKLKMYDKAFEYFDKAVADNFDDSEVYFYAAVCCLKGRKAFLTPRTEIDKALEYMNAAVMIEPKGIYYYFMAYIKYDYFKRKYLITTPNHIDLLNTARSYGVSDYDINQLFAVLGTENTLK